MQSTSIQGIPAGIVNNHNEVLYFWVGSGIKNATLFRIDAHHDMVDYCAYGGELTPDSYRNFNNANFNCPAVYHGIVSSIYWLNPHSQERRLQDLGTIRYEENRRKIGVNLENRLSNYDKSAPLYIWHIPHFLKYDGYDAREEIERDRMMRGKGKIILPQEICLPQESPLLVDIDLDAFCSHFTDVIHYAPRPVYDGVSNFKRRIEETTKMLRLLRKPDLITIARSLGDGYNECFVPPDLVEEVQICLIKKLGEIY